MVSYKDINVSWISSARQSYLFETYYMYIYAVYYYFLQIQKLIFKNIIRK